MQNSVTEQMELHQKLFDQMLNRFDIPAKQIAEAANISEVMISRFRRGKADLGTTKFLAMLAAIPDEEAKDWYVSQLLGTKPKVNLRSLVLEASPQEKAEILNVIAGWVVQKPNHAGSINFISAAS